MVDLGPLGWKPVKIKPPERWRAIKDCRVPANTTAFRRMQNIHNFVREKIEYRPEQTDDWSKPGDTLARGHGDCEDFCILERALLLNAGYRDEDIEMMIVYDKVTRQTHAILWVGPEHFTDNRSFKVEHISQFKDFEPIQGHRGDGSVTYGKG